MSGKSKNLVISKNKRKFGTRNGNHSISYHTREEKRGIRLQGIRHSSPT